MPLQKNSGNKRSKKESGVASKNRRFIQNFVDDIRKDGSVSDIYICRVLKKMGNGRVEIFYVDEDKKPKIVQSIIRGSFRGKGKHAVWIETGSVVVVSHSDLSGSAEYEIMAVLTTEQLHEIRKEMEIDPRIFAIENTDATQLLTGNTDEGGFVFDTTVEKEEEIDIAAI